MRIVLVTEVFLPKVDGIVNTLCHLLEYFQRKGDTCLIVAPEGSVKTFAGCQVIGVPGFKIPFYPELKLSNPFFSLNQQLDEFQPDLVHIANPFSIGVIGMRYAQSRHIPIAASYHTDIPGFAARWGWGAFSGGLQSYMRWLHNQADINLCPSNTTRNYLAHQGYKRLHVWTRGVDTGRFMPQAASPEMRRKLSANHPDARLLLYVGRLSAEKRVDWLKPILEAEPQARLAIVGDGPQRSHLEEVFQGMPVKFMGYLHGSELASAYASSDIFTFPGANETFGNVALEAMASGLPVVAPRAGGLLDFVEHGHNGLLFPEEDQTALVEQTLQLIHQPELALQIGRAGLQTASQRSWNMVLDALSIQYVGLIEHGYSRSINKRSVRPVRKMGWNEGL